jgi:hypothetical protein
MKLRVVADAEGFPLVPGLKGAQTRVHAAAW